MALNRRTWVRFVVLGLLVIQAALITSSIRRESLTFDEPDHMYAGYRMWTAADYGLNPEHPPLVKLLAAVPLLGQKLWTPPPMPTTRGLQPMAAAVAVWRMPSR